MLSWHSQIPYLTEPLQPGEVRTGAVQLERQLGKVAFDEAVRAWEESDHITDSLCRNPKELRAHKAMMARARASPPHSIARCARLLLLVECHLTPSTMSAQGTNWRSTRDGWTKVVSACAHGQSTAHSDFDRTSLGGVLCMQFLVFAQKVDQAQLIMTGEEYGQWERELKQLIEEEDKHHRESTDRRTKRARWSADGTPQVNSASAPSNELLHPAFAGERFEGLLTRLCDSLKCWRSSGDTCMDS